jgi:hypothetical protein
MIGNVAGGSPPCQPFAASVPRPRGAHCRPPWNPLLASSLLGGLLTVHCHPAQGRVPCLFRSFFEEV